jgi:hypothetical protein
MGSRVGQGKLPEDWLAFCLINCQIAVEALEAYAKTPVYKSDRVRELQQLLNAIIPQLNEVEFNPMEPAKREGKGNTRSRGKKRRRR